MTELIVFGTVGILEGAALLPLLRWCFRKADRIAKPGGGVRMAATAAASLVAFGLDMLPLTFAATLAFPALPPSDVELRGVVWLLSWLAGLAAGAAVWYTRRRRLPH